MFEQAIEELERSGCRVGMPESFQHYVSRYNLSKERTAQYISVNQLSNLRPELVDAECMVFRLGSSPGENYTQFALAKYRKGWSDYFLLDSELFDASDAEVFLPSVSVRSLFAHQLLPKLTESSLVNLALASGLLPEVLGILPSNEQIIPATGQSTFTFGFRPRSDDATLLMHRNGQVEIDALFVGKRNERECLFVVEAKASKAMQSLAKHKLLYPLLALKNSVPTYMDVVPVYMRVIRKSDSIDFNVAECDITWVNGEYGALDELVVKAINRYSLLGY